MNTPFSEHYLAQYRGAMANLPGNSLPWLQLFRDNQLSGFRSQGLPGSLDESWKYTDTRSLSKKQFDLAWHADEIVFERNELPRSICPNSINLVFLNGQYQPEISDTDAFPAGLNVCSIRQVIEEDPLRIRPYLGQIMPKQQDGFMMLNSSMVATGIFIEVVENTRITRPIECLYLNTENQTMRLSQPRNLVLIGKNALAAILERYHGNSVSAMTNSVSEIVLQADSNLTCYQVIEAGSQSYHISGNYLAQQTGSKFNGLTVVYSGRMVRNQQHVRLMGEKADATLRGISLGQERANIDHALRIEHCKANASSKQEYRSIVDDRARVAFTGMIHVAEDASGSNAEQTNNNILLSRFAEADSRPQLEIYNNEVKCSHGATIGKLDQNALFYLRNRGINQEHAIAMLSLAFIESMLVTIGDENIRNYLIDRFRTRLGKLKSIANHA